MNRHEAEEHLSAYLDGELDEVQAAEVEAHLKSDAELQAMCADLETLTRLAGDLPEVEPSTRVFRKVLTAVHPDDRSRKRTDFGPVLTADELMEFLRIDRATLETCIGDIPCFELGGKLLFRRDSVDAWILERERNFRRANPVSQSNTQTGGTSWTP